MPRMVCMKCNLFFHSKKNGVTVEEGMPRGLPFDPVTGEKVDVEWVPYKLWRADLWECRGCGTLVTAGFADGPFAEHYQPDYEKLKETYGPIVSFVKDCL